MFGSLLLEQVNIESFNKGDPRRLQSSLSPKAASLTRIGITSFWRFCPNFPIEAQDLFDHLKSINESPIDDPKRRCTTLIVENRVSFRVWRISRLYIQDSRRLDGDLTI
ncbi:hypothetical protein L1987_56370 [Smallanthus sonchifolius]|uniref:Uncharacterized protein n=1 Tax=Smallanthus sonchifolius TaxID=185202 RepID=A0ACB9EC63_9ASTR|nr:hypothetical protein L1987_56370 [Smallanthus sonchifolius]